MEMKQRTMKKRHVIAFDRYYVTYIALDVLIQILEDLST